MKTFFKMISPFQIKNPVDIHHFRDEISNLNSGQSQIPPFLFCYSRGLYGY